MTLGQFQREPSVAIGCKLEIRGNQPLANASSHFRISDVWQHIVMSQTYGMESPRKHNHGSLRQPSRYLVLIDSGGYMVARLFLETREQVAEFDGAAEEVATMTIGLEPEVGALGPEWDRALQGHSADERAAAMVYTFEI
ncbi:MAG: hypothetical protein Q7U79_09555 [Rhodoferax sp.]|nr:hypothetical protein [Rhodoferax sp.]